MTALYLDSRFLFCRSVLMTDSEPVTRSDGRHGLEQVTLFNDHLKRLHAAGVPVDIGLGESLVGPKDRSLVTYLATIENDLLTRIHLNQRITDAIAESQHLSPRYRSAIEFWLQTDSVAAFEALVQPGRSQKILNRQVGTSLIQPLVLIILTFIAFIILCSFTVPQWASVYSQLWKQPTGLLGFLLQVRSTMPVWSVVLPIFFGAVAFLGYRRSAARNWSWLPGATRYHAAMRYADIADRLAILTEQRVALPEAMRMADPAFASEFETSPDKAPPLLHWAMTGDLDGEPLPKVLRFVARSYREAAEEFAGGLRNVFPALLAVLIGGSLVYGFGILLFLPMTELLHTISIPTRD